MTGRIMKSSKWNFLMFFLYKLKTFSLETKKLWSSVKKRESNVKCSTILSSPTYVVATTQQQQQQQQQHFISPHNIQEIKIYNNSTDDNRGAGCPK